MGHRPPVPDVTALADALAALSSATRLLILHEIRAPKALREIEVPPEGQDASEGARNVARQTVRHHLDRLMEAGVVVSRPAEREYGSTVEYVVNHQALYALAEEFRSLARLRPTAEPWLMTQRGEHVDAEPGLTGPCLVLVKGIDEGRSFPLDPAKTDRARWTIGRKRGVDVALDFDPFVSSENAVVTFEDGKFHVADLPGSANGTTLNFRRLRAGERAALGMGDVVGVGRSLLLFRA